MRRFYFSKPQELLQHILSRGVRDGDCLLWTGVQLKGGYGNQRVEGRWVQVHRLRYYLEYGRFDPKLFVCHTCDEPSCFEITHLYLSNNRGNIRDARKKGNIKGNPNRDKYGRFTFNP